MYSKAKIAGHPIHPMLVAFPIAFYVSTVVSLVVFGGTGNPFWFHVAFVAATAAVVMGLGAAVPGLVDLVSLPPRSRARSTGIQHAGLNIFTLIAFAIIAVVLGSDWYNGANVYHFGWPLVLGLFGLAALCIAGTLGWKLVQTHHVGVKPTHLPLVTHAVDEVDDLDELTVTQACIAAETAQHAPAIH